MEIVVLYFAVLALGLAWPRSRAKMAFWLQLIWIGILRRITGRRPADCAEIRRMERELGLGPEPEKEHRCGRGGIGCGVGCSAPAVRDSVEDRSDGIYSWGSPSPIRAINYPRPDPAPRLPDPPRPQTELRMSRNDLNALRRRLPKL